jgi:hypothetical protein
MATTNNSTSTSCAFQTPTGTTSGGEGTMEQRLARDQFSTREQVVMYHRIMLSDQFIVRQYVYAHNDTMRSED